MTSAACINKIRFLHCTNNIRKNLIRGNVAVHLIYYTEFLNIKMNKGIIHNSIVHRHFQERHKMIPVVMICNRINKRHFIKVFFVQFFYIVINYDFRTVVIKLPLIKNTDFLSAATTKNADYTWFVFNRKIAVLSVGIICFCYFFKYFFYRMKINFNLVINLYRIKKCFIKHN